MFTHERESERETRNGWKKGSVEREKYRTNVKKREHERDNA